MKNSIKAISTAAAMSIFMGCIVTPKLYEKSIDELTFRTRDTIQLGDPQHGYFRNVVGPTRSIDGSYLSHSNLDDGHAFNKYAIWAIDGNFPYSITEKLKRNDGIIAVYEKASFFSLLGYLSRSSFHQYIYIDVRSAVNNGELVLKKNPDASKNPSFTDKNAFLCYAKQRKIEENALAEEYLYRFQKDLYDKGHNDEFERERMLQTSNTRLRNEVQEVDFKQKYYIYTSSLEFGEYNFAKKGFPIQNKGSELIVADAEGQYQPIGLSFSNLKDFQFVAVPEDEASQLIKRVKSREDVLGNISRKVYAIINFEISPSKAEDRLLQGRIVDIELYEFPVTVQGQGYNWIGTMK